MLEIFNKKKQTDSEKEVARALELLKRYTPPHDLISREVTQKDVKRVLKEAQVLFNLCFIPTGIYPGARAVAHPQIDDKDPLRFFVTKKQWLIVNPVIIRQTQHKTLKPEGCLTFHMIQPKMEFRSYKLELEYQTVDEEGELTDRMVSQFKGEDAQMVQHEMGHLNAEYIYNKKAYYEALRLQKTNLPQQ